MNINVYKLYITYHLKIYRLRFLFILPFFLSYFHPFSVTFNFVWSTITEQIINFFASFLFSVANVISLRGFVWELSYASHITFCSIHIKLSRHMTERSTTYHLRINFQKIFAGRISTHNYNFNIFHIIRSLDLH